METINTFIETSFDQLKEILDTKILNENGFPLVQQPGRGGGGTNGRGGGGNTGGYNYPNNDFSYDDGTLN